MQKEELRGTKRELNLLETRQYELDPVQLCKLAILLDNEISTGSRIRLHITIGFGVRSKPEMVSGTSKINILLTDSVFVTYRIWNLLIRGMGIWFKQITYVNTWKRNPVVYVSPFRYWRIKLNTNQHKHNTNSQSLNAITQSLIHNSKYIYASKQHKWANGLRVR